MKIKITLSKIFVIIISLGIFVPILSAGIQFNYQDSIGPNPNGIDFGDYKKNPIDEEISTEDNNPPTLLYPSNGAYVTDTTPYLDWSDVPAANLYNLQVARDSGFTNIVVDIDTTASSYICPTLSQGTHYWRVRTRHQIIFHFWGPFGSPFSFIIDSVPPARVYQTSPSNGVISYSSSLSLYWGYVSTATQYHFQVDDSPSFTSPYRNGYTASLYYTTSYPNDQYYWRVQARDAAGNWGAYSPIWSFNVNTNPPVLVSPASGTLTNNPQPTLDWSIAGAAQNELQISYNSGFTNLRLVAQTGTTTGYTCPVLSDNTYYWRVRARDALGNWGSYSSYRSFEIDTTAPDRPKLITPLDGSVDSNSTPTLLWNSVPDATLYDIELDDDPAFGSAFQHQTVNTYYTMGTLPDDVYHWRVRARDFIGNWGLWSPINTFTIDTVAPVITDITHLPVTIDDTMTVTFLCDVSDLVGVGNVNLFYRINEGFWSVIGMDSTTGDEYAAVLGPFAYNNFIEYYIEAVDTAIHQNVATNDNGGSYFSFTIISSDNTGPTILYLGYSPGSPTELSTITISCNASDPNGVNDTILSYRINGGAWINTSMALISGITYTLDIGPFSYADFIEFFITAIDDYVLHNEAVENNTGVFYSFTVGFSDVTGPTIEDIEHTPFTPTDAQNVEISCSVTDANGIHNVTLYYRINGGNWISISMILTTGSTYAITIGSFDYNDLIEYHIYAFDDSPNINEAIEDNGGAFYSFTVVSSDVTGPVIDDIIHTANNTELDLVNITCTVTDANGIQLVTLYYRINNGTWQSITMNLITGDTYGASIGPYAVGDIIEYYIVAIDDSPNHNSATDDNGGLYYSVEIIPTPTQINSLVYYIPVLAVLALAIVIRRKR